MTFLKRLFGSIGLIYPLIMAKHIILFVLWRYQNVEIDYNFANDKEIIADNISLTYLNVDK